MKIIINKYNLLVEGVLSLIGGIILILMSIFAYGALINITCAIIGIIITIHSLYWLVISLTLLSNNANIDVNVQNEKLKEYTGITLVLSALGTILGFWFIFNHGLALSIIFGIYLIAFPAIRIMFALNKKEQLKQEAFSLILAIIIIVLTSFNALDTVLKIILIILGAIIALSGIVEMILYYKEYKEIRNIVIDKDAKDTIEVEAENIEEK